MALSPRHGHRCTLRGLWAELAPPVPLGRASTRPGRDVGVAPVSGEAADWNDSVTHRKIEVMSTLTWLLIPGVERLKCLALVPGNVPTLNFLALAS